MCYALFMQHKDIFNKKRTINGCNIIYSCCPFLFAIFICVYHVVSFLYISMCILCCYDLFMLLRSFHVAAISSCRRYKTVYKVI